MPRPFPPRWACAWGTDRDSPFPYADVDLGSDVTMRLRWIPAGPFVMGSPESEAGRWETETPQHAVVLTRGFWLGETPCTQAEWKAVMGTTPSRFKGERRPVEQVNWEDCKEFCRKLGERVAGLSPRLPTEAEWEYACRAGTTSAFNDGSPCTQPKGNDPALAKLGWFDANSGGETHSAGGLAPNAWGLRDMHGNVWEWCEDWSGDYRAEEQVDPTGASAGQGRVIRGGSWSRPAWCCRSACRDGGRPAGRVGDLGFRLAAGQR
jgi:formylglycine-generating enzyme required for sulfatase activity